MNPFAFFLAIADKVHTALNLLDPTRTYAAADALWAQQRGAGRGRCAELLEEIRDLRAKQMLPVRLRESRRGCRPPTLTPPPGI